MRVLHLNAYLSPEGGVETYLIPVLSAQAARGTGVGLFHAQVGERSAARVDFPATHLPQLHPAAGPASARKQAVLDAVEQFAPDVIHLHKLDDPRLPEWLGERYPIVQFVHDHFPFACPGYGKFLVDKRIACTRALGGFCLLGPYLQHCGSRAPWRHLPRYLAAQRYRRAAPFLRRLLVASRHMKEELILNGLPPDKVEVLGLPVPQDLFPAKAPAWPSGETTPLVLAVGRLIPHKGFDLLLAALSRISVPCRLEIVGAGPEHEPLSRLAEQLRPPVEARCVGPLSRAQLADRYAAARLVVLPSAWPEPFGLVGLEAMAAARPVVAFAVGGVSDWLRSGETGFLAPAGDVAALAAHVTKLLEEPALGRELGRRGRECVEREYTLEKHLSRLDVLYATEAGAPPASLSSRKGMVQ